VAFLQSYGAVEVVTGSCHVLHLETGEKIMVDCGMFQGAHEHENCKPFAFDPSEIDMLLVTMRISIMSVRFPNWSKRDLQGGSLPCVRLLIWRK